MSYVDEADMVKLPPSDLEAEEAVLGSVLIDPEAMPKVAFLKAEDFYREKNRWAWGCCLALYQRGVGVNQITVAHELAGAKRLEAAGGPGFLAHLVSQTPTSVHVVYYAEIVARLSSYRQLITASNKIAAIGYESPPDVGDAISKSHDILSSLSIGVRARVRKSSEIIDDVFEDISNRRHKGDEDAVYSGLRDLDGELGGFHPGDFVIIGGRPSMGKTALMLKIARSMNANVVPSLFCSGEQSDKALMERNIAVEAGVSVQDLNAGRFTDSQMDKVVAALDLLKDSLTDYTAGRSLRVLDVRMAAEEAKARYGVKAVFVDYLQLMMDEKGESMAQRAGWISRNLKAIGQDLGIVVFCASQFNRQLEARSNKRPLLSDLRESGDIEQDADIALLLYRDEHYYTEEEWQALHPDKNYPKNIAEIHIAKNRQGPVGARVKVYFRPHIMSFEDLVMERQGGF
jgi:replicative DNA helicase